MTQKLDLNLDDDPQGQAKLTKETLSLELDGTTVKCVEENNKPKGNTKEKVRKGKKSQESKVSRKVQYIGYASISIICPIIVMIIWQMNQKDSKGTLEVVKNETLPETNTCPFWHLTGDGYCDDEANIPECGYDFADCCELENDRSFCSNCPCH